MNDTAPGTEDVVLVRVEGRVGIVTLNRPAARNAMNRVLVRELRRIVEEHGGTVAVEEHDGAGARIVATLPGSAEQNGTVHPRFDEATAAWGSEPDAETAEATTGVVGTPS